jgi:hypothetical protein
VIEKEPGDENIVIEVKKTEQHTIRDRILNKRPVQFKNRLSRRSEKYKNWNYYKKEKKKNMCRYTSFCLFEHLVRFGYKDHFYFPAYIKIVAKYSPGGVIIQINPRY